MNIPSELRYAESHEWARVNDDGSVTIGVSDHAQNALGDVVFVETPNEDGQVDAGQPCAVVESVKAASDIYAPVSGVVVETNPLLAERPELINESPYEDGWIFRVQPDDESQLEALMSAADYEATLD